MTRNDVSISLQAAIVNAYHAHEMCSNFRQGESQPYSFQYY
jgi:hypothetical protein